jgi:hypothetical protein
MTTTTVAQPLRQRRRKVTTTDAYFAYFSKIWGIPQRPLQETVGHVTSAPGSTDVGAEVESSPTERRSHIDWRRRIDRRARANFSGIRRHRKCQQRRYGDGRMEPVLLGEVPALRCPAVTCTGLKRGASIISSYIRPPSVTRHARPFTARYRQGHLVGTVTGFCSRGPGKDRAYHLTEPHDELAPYSITSSAISRNASEIVSPSSELAPDRFKDFWR